MSNEYICAYVLFVIGWVVNLLETWYFGWNIRPACMEECVWDGVSEVMVVGGFIMMLVRTWKG